MRAFPAASAIADSTLSINESARKIYVFTFNIRGRIYARGDSERVRVFPAASAIANSTLSINKNAREICVFISNIRGRIYARGGSERVCVFRPLR